MNLYNKRKYENKQKWIIERWKLNLVWKKRFSSNWNLQAKRNERKFNFGKRLEGLLWLRCKFRMVFFCFGEGRLCGSTTVVLREKKKRAILSLLSPHLDIEIPASAYSKRSICRSLFSFKKCTPVNHVKAFRWIWLS